LTVITLRFIVAQLFNGLAAPDGTVEIVPHGHCCDEGWMDVSAGALYQPAVIGTHLMAEKEFSPAGTARGAMLLKQGVSLV